ncbi:BatA domain-containing protein [Granulosicoccus antarcticus]|uniref:VWFA domain-containing protein n=1 Tax=Granulosicoccus antarcticus IMCC3135 TaxID=1192854 RepID=A0A2Z2NTZ3_9GAMM|nr:VWA domain-containing protein [Granulosicoccus antarcticus]ASJ74743.1 hypothetical protein IMCC3135_23370 [Granulosicoccus antarcticus IMCC3135]
MSLLFPAYLAGLLALGLPWLLHRFSDQQADEQRFPSSRFLEPTTPPVSRTRQLKYRVLLALRILSLLLLCFLFAQPWIARQSGQAMASRHHIVAIDQSLSMRAEARWETAVQQVRSVLDELPANDSVELVGFDTKVRRLGSNRDESVTSIRQSLANLQPGYLASDYGLSMQALNSLATEQDMPVKVWMITDIQQSALPVQLNALYAPQISELEVQSVITQDQRNVHLSATALSSDGANVQINVQLMSSETQLSKPVNGAKSELAEPVTVQVIFDDQVLAEQRTVVSAGALETLVFDRLVLPASSNPVFTVSIIEPDSLPEDNSVDVVVKMARPMPVVLLQSEADVSDNASVFLSTALETDSLAEVQGISGNAENVPADTRTIITARNLAAPIAVELLQYVDTDANALVFRSDVPMQAEEASVQGSEIGLVDEAHPLSLGQLSWYGTRFFDVPNITLGEQDRVLLQTRDSQPILIERPTARGRLLILNDRLDGVGSNLPLQPVFVALMQSILNYFDASTALPDQITIGNRLALPAQVQVLDPDDEPLLTLEASAHSGAIELTQPGLYKIIGARGEHALQVVLDARETDLTTVNDSALEAWQARYLEAGDDLSVADTALNSSSRQAADKLLLAQGGDASRWAAWQILLPLLVLALMLESGFANRRLDVRRDGS